SQAVIGESLSKAEVARSKAAEEALEAAKARDEAVAALERTRREAEQLRRRVEALEQAKPGAASAGASELETENEALKRKLKLAQDQATDLERSLGSLKAQLEAAQFDAKAARAAVAQAGQAAGATDGNEQVVAIKEKADEVYGGINENPGELRNDARAGQAGFAGVAGGGSPEAGRITSETLQTGNDSAEDAKGLPRGLPGLVVFG